jgi:N-formylglutamate deformylase
VARNTPYAGGHTTVLYGRPASGCHALQIEVNRALYLDEDRIVKKAAFDLVRERLTRALRSVLAMPSSQLGRPNSLPEAAE